MRLKEIVQVSLDVIKAYSDAQAKVLVVEEAGQVLESHILAALSPSIQHLIQIGDPAQLRCIANVYQLSVDTARGSGPGEWRYNESMMERLSSQGLEMRMLGTQRRMRPQISALIR